MAGIGAAHRANDFFVLLDVHRVLCVVLIVEITGMNKTRILVIRQDLAHSNCTGILRASLQCSLCLCNIINAEIVMAEQ